MKTLSLLIAISLSAFLFGQTERFPNVTKDKTASRSLMGIVGIDNALPGYSAVTLEGVIINPNKYYLRLNAGVGIVYNLKYAKDDGFDHEWWSPVGAIEIGYPLNLGVKQKQYKFVTSQGNVYESNSSKVWLKTEFYNTKVPKRFLLTPLMALNYEPLPFVLRSFNGGLEGFFTQRLLTLNMGVKLMRIVNADLLFVDKESKATLTGNGKRYSSFYFGIDIPLQETYETDAAFTNIFKSDRPTYELYFSLPNSYLNSVMYFDIGIKSMPFARKSSLTPLETRGGTYQLYFAYKIYL